MKRNSKEIRKYRRLRRKAKALKTQRAVRKFILNKIIPFAFFRFLFKKNSWITFGVFILSLFYNFGNNILKTLSLSLVDIANETIRQHSIYKKSSLAPLDDIDYQNLIEESISSNILDNQIEELLDSRNSLPSESP